jgi:DNA-binding NarL/FixJ family response regulator
MTPSMPTRVIFLTLQKDPVYLNAALDAGVHGYVLKDSASSEIGAAIKSVHAGQRYLSAVLSGLLIDRSLRADALAKALPALDTLAS